MVNKLLILQTRKEVLKNTYAAKDGLYQHYNQSLIAGTRDFPRDRTGDFKLSLNDTSNKTERGRDSDVLFFAATMEHILL